MMQAAVRKYSMWWYYALSVTITLAVLLSVTWYVADRFRDFFVDQQRDSLEVYARKVSKDIEENGLPVVGTTGL